MNMKYVVLLGRILFSAIFIFASINHFHSDTVAYAQSAGVPMPQILVPLSGLIALVGGLSILFGYKAKYGAWLIVLFLVPVTFMMHRYWEVDNPILRALQQAMFWKNLSMLGGALIVAYFGSGPMSLDEKKKRR